MYMVQSNISQELRIQVLKSYNYVCSSCGYNRHVGSLHIHHVDNDKNNNDLSNLTVLCGNCHFEYHHKNKRYVRHDRINNKRLLIEINDLQKKVEMQEKRILSQERQLLIFEQAIQELRCEDITRNVFRDIEITDDIIKQELKYVRMI